jgi:hypothetical protein
MSQKLTADEAWRQLVGANIRYYQSVGQLAADYMKTVTGLIGRVESPLRAPVDLSSWWKAWQSAMTGATSTRASSAGASPREAAFEQMDAPAQEPTSRSASPALLLEAGSGRAAVGAFLVENKMDHTITAPVMATTLRSTDGREATPTPEFAPRDVTLAPGEQAVVRVSVRVDDSFEHGVPYRGEILVRGLHGGAIPLVVRRVEDAQAAAAGGVAKSARKRRTRRGARAQES